MQNPPTSIAGTIFQHDASSCEESPIEKAEIIMYTLFDNYAVDKAFFFILT
jgi:hypothetical protein